AAGAGLAAGRIATTCGACTTALAIPRLRMTRRSPSRTSTVLRSCAAISETICSSSATSMGLLDGGPLRGGLAGFWDFRFSLNVATLEAPVEAGEDLASGVSNEHVVLDADAAFARQVDSGFDGDDQSGAKLLFAAGFAHRGQFVDFAADAVAEPVAELLGEPGPLDHVAGNAVGR